METRSHSSGRGASHGSRGPDASYDIPDSDSSHDPNQSRSYSPSKQRCYDSDESAREHTNFHYHLSSKRHKNGKKCRTKENSDRISALPDSVLHHILSFLPMEDAVKTGVLSKSWSYMWTYITNLVYVERWPSDAGFTDFINKTLMLHDSSKIKRLVISIAGESGFDSHVDLWIRVATRKRVEELHLDFFWGLYSLPQHLYTNSSLTEFNSKLCHFAPSGRVCWMSLKILSIGYSKLSNDVIRTILLGSPVLEYLKLQDCEGFNRLDITSQSLRKFVIDDCWESTGGDDGYVLEISGPNLRSLEMSGHLVYRKCRLMNVSSLVDASLNFDVAFDDEDRENSYEEHRNMLRELLENLSYVKELTIGTLCIQLLSILEVKFLPSPLSKRKCLILNTKLHKWDFPGIASLLESSPDLEKLVINMTSPYKLPLASKLNFSSSYEFDGEKYWTSQKRIFKCLLLHLKTVEIFGFEIGRNGIDELVTSLLQFLLKNARVLEKMVIYKDKVGEPWMSPCTQKLLEAPKLFELAQKLLSCPRSSPDAVVLFS